MEYREVVSAAKRLPMSEQFQLVEELLRGMRQTATRSPRARRRPTIRFSQLRGALKSAHSSTNDNGDPEEAYTQHLMEKYL